MGSELALSVQDFYTKLIKYRKLVQEMDLKNKKVLIFCGPSRSGKGTMIQCLKGTQMKLLRKSDLSKDMQEKLKISGISIMCPVDSNSEPILSEIISHERNSHTLIPSIQISGNYPP
jgi:Fe-S cluster assembly ATPase SufC